LDTGLSALVFLDEPDFDRYVDEHGIPEENRPAAFGLGIAERNGRAGTEVRKGPGA
jgi:hypothetical protein